jgi:uncharacterized protein YxjI
MFQRSGFLVKERVGFLKFSDVFDLFDLQTGQPAGQAAEVNGGLIKIVRLLIAKQLLPNRLEARESEGAPLSLVLEKGFSLLRSRIRVSDGNGRFLGTLVSKILSWGGGFHLLDAQDQKVAELSGDWKGWNFKMTGADGREWGTITKKWAGVGREFFTSADNYAVVPDASAAGDSDRKALLLAAALAVDVVYKEKK